MRTMSEFIMEQEVTTEDINENIDVEVMESFMKMTAIAGVAECYCEHAAISAFAESEGLSVFSESDENIFKKAWGSVKSFFEMIWDWLKAIVKAVIQMITRSSLEKLIVRIKEWINKGVDDEGHKFAATDESNVPAVIIDANNVLALVEEFSEYIKAGYNKETMADKLNDFQKRAKEFVENFKNIKKEKGGTTDYKERTVTDSIGTPTGVEKKGSSSWGEVLAVLERMQKNNIATSAHKLLKNLDFKKKEWKEKDAEKYNNDDVKKVKEAAKWVAKAYDKYTDFTVKLVQKVIKKQLKKERLEDLKGNTKALENVNKSGGDYEAKEARKAAKKAETETTESYVDNTDGYFFL